MRKVNKKLRKIDFKVYADFYTGLAIAWFSGGALTLFFPRENSTDATTSAMVALFISWLSLHFAVGYRRKAGS